MAEREVEEALVDLSKANKGTNEAYHPTKNDTREREHMEKRTTSIPTVTVTPPDHHADNGFRDSTDQTASGVGKCYITHALEPLTV